MKQRSNPDEPQTVRRIALAPGLVGSVTAILSVFAIGTEWFFVVSFVIAVVALIIGWFAVQSRQWWWLPLPTAIAVVWNPVFPLAFADGVWLPLQYIAAAAFIAAGLSIRVSDDVQR